MKKVFNSNDELCKAWASEKQNFGKTKNMFFEGPALYSYGRHYMVAYIHTLSNGEKIYFVNQNHYSRTTQRHQSIAWRAVFDNKQKFWVTFPGSNLLSLKLIPQMIETLNFQMVSKIEKHMRSRKYWYGFKSAENIYKTIQQIGEIFNLSIPELPANWEAARQKGKEMEVKARQQFEEDKKNPFGVYAWINRINQIKQTVAVN
jgi:hypothetical protein